jgi:hypothetical protein
MHVGVSMSTLRSLSAYLALLILGTIGLIHGKAQAGLLTFGCGGTALTCRLDELTNGAFFVAGQTLFRNWTVVNLPVGTPPGQLTDPLKTSLLTIKPIELPPGNFGNIGFDIIPGTFPTQCVDFGALETHVGLCEVGVHARISFKLFPTDGEIQGAAFIVDFGSVNG